MAYPTYWNVGTEVKTHAELQERPKVQELAKRWIWQERLRRWSGWLDSWEPSSRWLDPPWSRPLPISSSEIETFLNKHPWLSITFKISSTTPLEHVLSYFHDIAEVEIMTEFFRRASITSHPIMHGGLADIYQATLEDGSVVAIKRLRQRPDGDNKELKRTARELDTWSKLEHPNILKLLGLAELYGKLSMVSPWMAYGNAVSAVKERPDIDRYALCTQLVDAVAYLHSIDINVVHGDIKGDNVLLDESRVVKLTDFGLSLMHEQSMRYSETDPGGGTIRWMAPELFMEDGTRSRETDVYALGMTMMEILTGRIPFSEIRLGHMVIQAVSQHKRIPNVSELRAETNSGREAIMLGTLLRCWRYEADKRPTAAEVQALMRLLGPP